MEKMIKVPKCEGCAYTCWYCINGMRENSSQVSCAHDYHMHSRTDTCAYWRANYDKTNFIIPEEQLD